MTDLRIIFTMFLIAVLACCCASIKAADPVAARYGITLAPNETLVSVNGIPVAGNLPLVPSVLRVAMLPVRVVNQVTTQMIDNQQQRAVVRQCVRDARGNWSCGQ